MPQWIDLSFHNANLRVEQHADGERNLVLLLNDPLPAEALTELGFWRDERGLLIRAGKKVSLAELRKHFPQAAAQEMPVDAIVFTYAPPPAKGDETPLGDPLSPSSVRIKDFKAEATTVRIGANVHVIWRGERYPTEIEANETQAVALVHRNAVAASMQRAETEGPSGWPPPSFAVASDHPYLIYGRGAVAPRPSTVADHNVARLIQSLDIVELLMSNAEDAHLVVKNPPYTDLVIERLPYDGTGRDALYLTHYRDINFDRVMDCEMVFLIDGYRLRLQETATLNFRGGELRGRDLEFAKMFSRNLLEQGFGDGKVVCTREPEATQRESDDIASTASVSLDHDAIQDHQLDAAAGAPVGVNALGEIVTETQQGTRERHLASGTALAQHVANDQLYVTVEEGVGRFAEGDVLAGRAIEAIHPLTRCLLATRPAFAGPDVPDVPHEAVIWETLAFDRHRGAWAPLRVPVMPDQPSRAMLIALAGADAFRDLLSDPKPELDVRGFIEHVNAHACEGDYQIPTEAVDGGIHIERAYGSGCYYVTCADRRIPYLVTLDASIDGYLPSLSAGTDGETLLTHRRQHIEQALRWAAQQLANVRDEYLMRVHVDNHGEPCLAITGALFDTVQYRSRRGALEQLLGAHVRDHEGDSKDEPFPWENLHCELQLLDQNETASSVRALRLTFMGDVADARPCLTVTEHIPSAVQAPTPESEKRTLGIALRHLWLESKLRETLGTHPAYEGVTKIAHDYAQALHRANPSAPAMPGRQHWAFAGALITRDHKALVERLAKPDGVNRSTKAFFEQFSGLRLKRTPRAIAAQLEEWAGVAPAHIVLQNRRRIAERDFHAPGRSVEDMTLRAGTARSSSISASLGHSGEPMFVKDAIKHAFDRGWRLGAHGGSLIDPSGRGVALTALERDYAQHLVRIARTSAPSFAAVDEPMPAAVLR